MNMQAADPPAVELKPALQVLGLWTPEVDKLSDQGVRSFKAPVAKCLAHEFTSIESKNVPQIVYQKGKLYAKGVPEHAIGKTELKLFVVTPEIRAAAGKAKVPIKIGHVKRTDLAAATIARAPVVAIVKRE